jgi:hypothetical protein
MAMRARLLAAFLLTNCVTGRPPGPEHTTGYEANTRDGAPPSVMPAQTYSQGCGKGGM